MFQFKNTCVRIHTAFRNHTEYIISLYRIAFNLMIVLVCIEMFCYVFIVFYCIILVHVFITSQNNVKFSYRILIITSKLTYMWHFYFNKLIFCFLLHSGGTTHKNRAYLRSWRLRVLIFHGGIFISWMED